MNKIFITNNPDIAMHSIESGVDIIMVDLETIGKKERQKEFNTVISNHKLNDIIKIKKCIGNSTLLVRSNPIHKKIGEEIDPLLFIRSAVSNPFLTASKWAYLLLM